MFLDAMECSVNDAIKQLCKYKLEQGFELQAIHEYSNIKGDVEFRRVRLKEPNSGEKCVYPLRLNNAGKYELKEPVYDRGKKLLYRLPDVARCNNDIIYVVEGEACVDQLRRLGIIATTSGSWNSAHMADWTSLYGKKVVIWPDADKQGNKYADSVASILSKLGCKISIVDVAALQLLAKEDCVDWLEKHPQTTTQDILNFKVIEYDVHEDDTEQEGLTSSKSGMLLELVDDVECFHDQQSVTYATINIKDHEETWQIDNNYFHSWLSQVFWCEYREAISSYAIRAVTDIMTAKARYEGKCHSVYMRVGKLDNETYVYLANEKHEIVRFFEGGWEIKDKSPVKFVKNKNMKALPTPAAGGDLSLLWKYVNVPNKCRLLVIAWLLECLRIDTEYPILMLHGPQGAAKSTSQEYLRSLVDPNVSNLRGAPRNADDIIVAAANNYLISYNNLSNLTRSNQDDLCAVSTGGGIGMRQKYTDLEESLCEIKRPLIMNGINNPITARDLISRSIVIELPEISNEFRKSGSELRDQFIKDHPHILGGLYDLYVSVIKLLPAVNVSSKPRLADFALLGAATEMALGFEQGTFMSIFNDSMEGSMLNTLDSQPILWSLSKFITDKIKFRGTFAELLDELNSSMYKSKSLYGWPSSAKALAQTLKEVAPFLSKINIAINFPIQRTNRGMMVELDKCNVI